MYQEIEVKVGRFFLFLTQNGDSCSAQYFAGLTRQKKIKMYTENRI
jgi:hypothetical protein